MKNANSSKRVYWLLSELCSELGFSMPMNFCEQFEILVPLGIDAFTDEVLKYEGLDSRMNEQIRMRVREAVEKHFENWARNS